VPVAQPVLAHLLRVQRRGFGVLAFAVGLAHDALLREPEVDPGPEGAAIVDEPLLEHRPGQARLGQPPPRHRLEPVLGERIGSFDDERRGPHPWPPTPAVQRGPQLGAGDQLPAQRGVGHGQRIGRAQRRAAVQHEAGPGQHRNSVHLAHVVVGVVGDVYPGRRTHPVRPDRRAPGQHHVVGGAGGQREVQQPSRGEVRDRHPGAERGDQRRAPGVLGHRRPGQAPWDEGEVAVDAPPHPPPPSRTQQPADDRRVRTQLGTPPRGDDAAVSSGAGPHPRTDLAQLGGEWLPVPAHACSVPQLRVDSRQLSTAAAFATRFSTAS
jgi:hypothetical protein